MLDSIIAREIVLCFGGSGELHYVAGKGRLGASFLSTAVRPVRGIGTPAYGLASSATSWTIAMWPFTISSGPGCSCVTYFNNKEHASQSQQL